MNGVGGNLVAVQVDFTIIGIKEESESESDDDVYDNDDEDGDDEDDDGDDDNDDDDGNEFLGAPDTSDRWVRRIQGREMGSHLKDTRPLNHMYHLLYQMQHLQPVIRQLREALKKLFF